MPGFDGKPKHCALRNLLMQLGVDVLDATRDEFYTSGGEVTKRGLQEALRAVLHLKRRTHKMAETLNRIGIELQQL